jgi:uncharacterized protein
MALTSSVKRQSLLTIFSLLGPLAVALSGAGGSMIDPEIIIVFISVFLGSVVVGAAGFGSAAVGGAVMLFWFVPVSAVPILNAASLTTQLISLGELWKDIQWRGCQPLIVGGLFGIPAGVWLLQRTDPDLFRVVFGIFLLSWCGYLLARPHLKAQRRGAIVEGLVGVTGGVTGGAIAFPGAFPAIWTTITRETKEEQRGTIQIFIFVIQVATFFYLLANGLVGRDFLVKYAAVLPAIMIGTFVGVHLFRKINESLFRQFVLSLLLIAAITHLAHGLIDIVGQ